MCVHSEAWGGTYYNGNQWVDRSKLGRGHHHRRHGVLRPLSRFQHKQMIHFRAHLMMFTSDPDVLLDHHVVPALGWPWWRQPIPQEEPQLCRKVRLSLFKYSILIFLLKVGLGGGGGAPDGLHAAQRQPQRGGERDGLGHVLLQVYIKIKIIVTGHTPKFV